MYQKMESIPVREPMDRYFYIQLKQHYTSRKRTVLLKDVGTIYCENKEMKEILEELPVMELTEKDTMRPRIYSIFHLLKLLEEINYTINIKNLGETECIVAYEPKEKQEKKWIILGKVFFVCLTAFFGAGISIMGYNNDIDLPKIFSDLYYLLTGIKADGPTIMELFYSVGLTLGVLIFFQPFKKKEDGQPTPLKVQMKLYEKDLNETYVLYEEQKEQQKEEETQ